ncbi:hypothetical protein HDU77_007223 [Chytriomyces hyalinus]|nr:hypothetical protein HDU77_007223 [Chytriomyces hyalinus]
MDDNSDNDDGMAAVMAAIKVQIKKKTALKQKKLKDAFERASADIQAVALQAVEDYQAAIETLLATYNTTKDALISERHKILDDIKAEQQQISKLNDAFGKDAQRLCKQGEMDAEMFKSLISICNDARAQFEESAEQNSMEKPGDTVAKGGRGTNALSGKKSGISKATSVPVLPGSIRKSASSSTSVKSTSGNASLQLKRLFEAEFRS